MLVGVEVQSLDGVEGLAVVEVDHILGGWRILGKNYEVMLVSWWRDLHVCFYFFCS